MKNTKSMKGLPKQAHVSGSKSGDYKGTGIKNPMGLINGAKPKKMNKVPRALA